MEDKFEKELAELINKHGLEKKLGDTPDYILAKVAINAMVNFSGATKARDDWHGFRNADKPKDEKPASNNCDECPNSRYCHKALKKINSRALWMILWDSNDLLERLAISKELMNRKKNEAR